MCVWCGGFFPEEGVLGSFGLFGPTFDIFPPGMQILMRPPCSYIAGSGTLWGTNLLLASNVKERPQITFKKIIILRTSKCLKIIRNEFGRKIVHGRYMPRFFWIILNFDIILFFLMPLCSLFKKECITIKKVENHGKSRFLFFFGWPHWKLKGSCLQLDKFNKSPMDVPPKNS